MRRGKPVHAALAEDTPRDTGFAVQQKLLPGEGGDDVVPEPRCCQPRIVGRVCNHFLLLDDGQRPVAWQRVRGACAP